VRDTLDRLLAALRRIDWAGPLLVRVTLGLVFVTSGWGKLHALDNVSAYFGQLGIPAPGAQAVIVSVIEFVGGLLLIAGLTTRIVALLLVGVMAVAGARRSGARRRAALAVARGGGGHAR
jgi:putative oxidoreductase